MTAPRSTEDTVAALAAAIGEPARARMLYCLMDNRARTGTELALVAEVGPSTASTHLKQLQDKGLVRVVPQGKHRYYSLDGDDVARVLEGLSVLAGARPSGFVASTPAALRGARTCYDHVAGALGVALHDRLVDAGWLVRSADERDAYDLSAKGEAGFRALGVDVDQATATRRRFAFGCLDWSERRVHLGGALGAAILERALARRWVKRERDGRALTVTALGHRELIGRIGVRLDRER